MGGATTRSIPVGVSARHAHLSQKDLEALFGPGYKLTPLAPLHQPGQYAAAETVTAKSDRDEIAGIRILGPVRPRTQLEISLTDARKLGVLVPIRVQAGETGCSAITLVGPKGQVIVEEAAIAAMRHIHMNPADAQEFGVMDGDVVRVQAQNGRGLIFDSVVVRVRPDFDLEFHVDTDEANAANLRSGDRVTLIYPFHVPSGPR